MRTIRAILPFVCLTVNAFAGDGISQAELKPLLGKLTPRWQELEQSYDIQDVGTALRLPERINPTLSDRRILPFEFSARPKGSNGPYALTIEITGDNVFVDSKGREVDFTQANRCKVKPKEIQLHPH